MTTTGAPPRAQDWSPGLDESVIDAERSVLCAMLLEHGAIGRARALLDAWLFHSAAHARMFAVVLVLADRGEAADFISLTEELGRRGDLEVCGGRAGVAAISDYAGTSANLDVHAGIVREAWRIRELRRAAREAADAIERGESAEPVATILRAKLDRLGATKGAGRFADAAIDAATFGGRELIAPEPLLRYGRHSLLCAGDGALMFGKAGAGKTALALGLTVAVALGKEWFGISTPEGGVPVGLLELELPEDALQERLRGVAGDRLAALSNLHIVCRPALTGLVDFDTPEDRAALRSWVKNAGLRLVVIDALVRAHGKGEDDEGLKPLLLWLDALGRETGCAFLLLHHERKGDSQNGREHDPLDAARGHSMLTTYPMLCLRVYRHGPAKALAFPKVTRAPEPPPLFFRIGDGGVPEPCEAPEARSRAKGEGNRSRVLAALLAAYDGRTCIRAEQLEASTKLSRSTVRAHLTALVETGEVERVRVGRDIAYRPSVRASEQAGSDASNGLGPQ